MHMFDCHRFDQYGTRHASGIPSQGIILSVVVVVVVFVVIVVVVELGNIGCLLDMVLFMGTGDNIGVIAVGLILGESCGGGLGGLGGLGGKFNL